MSPWPRANSWLGKWLGLALVLAYATGVRLAVMDAPFHRHAEGTGCFYGILARNYLRYSWRETWGMPVLSVGYVPGTAPTFYSHHPPLVPLSIAVSYVLFGQGDWQTRLPAALGTLGSAALIFLLLWQAGRPRAGVIAAGIFAAMPMVLFYGGQPEVLGMPLILFALLSVLAYLHWRRRPEWRRWLLLCGAFALAAMSDWPAFILVPVVSGHMIWSWHRSGRREWREFFRAGGFGLFGTALLMIIVAYIVWATGQGWNELLKQVLVRAGFVHSGEGVRGTFTAVQWLAVAWRDNLSRHTLPVLLLALLWLAAWGWRGRDDEGAATLLLLSWAGLHVVIGRQGIYVHDWWWWPLTPGLAMAAALGLDRAIELIPRRVSDQWVTSAAALLLVGFATWTAWRTLPAFYSERYIHGPLDYSVVEMGQAIQAASADPNAPVIVAYDDLNEVQLWYYGDRPLRLGVWHMGDGQGNFDRTSLADRMNDTTNDLPFGFQQTNWPIAPAGLVFPKQFLPAAPEFAAELKPRWPYQENEKFLIFDLRR